jgi:3',5'-cyclic AMP phosphodiesterase CpdA
MPPLRIVQVSDTHLSQSHAYFQDNWTAFLDCMAEERPDFVFVTGDMCMNGPKVPEDLRFARVQLDRLPVPWRAIPGNHDIGDTPPDTRLKGPITRSRRAAYRKAFGDDFWVQDLGDWRFIGLNAQLMDSGLPGETVQMEMVADALASAAARQCAILIHKPLYNKSATERGQSLQALWPKSRKRLLALCEKHNVKLVASGHRHCYRSLRHGGTRLVWAPATSFIDTRKSNEGLRLIRRVGYIRYTLDGATVKHELIEPPLFVNNDMRNWMAAHGSTTKLPPRPLKR